MDTEKLTVFSMLLLSVLPAKGVYINRKGSCESERYNDVSTAECDDDAPQSSKSSSHAVYKDPNGFQILKESSIMRSLERDFPEPPSPTPPQPTKKFFSLLHMNLLDTNAGHGTYENYNNFQCRLAHFKNTSTALYKTNSVYISKTAKVRRKVSSVKENIMRISSFRGAKADMEYRLQKKTNLTSFPTKSNKKRIKRDIPGFKTRRKSVPIDFKISQDYEKDSSIVESCGDVPREKILELRRNRITSRTRYNVFREIVKLRDYLDTHTSTEGPVDPRQTPIIGREEMYDSYLYLRGKHFVGF